MTGKRVTKTVIILIMIVLSIISVLPFYMMINMGTYYANDLYTGIKLLPANYLKQNFATLMSINFPLYYLNSIIVAVSTSVLATLVCAMCGFGIAKYNFKFKNVCYSIILLTMMVPTQLSLVGYVLEMNSLGWLNTLLPIIVSSIASPFGAFWITQYTKGAIPDSVLESARLDGSSDFGIFWRIAMPFMMPGCMTLAMLSFLWSWNAFLLPMIVVSNDNLFTIPLGIRQLTTQFRFDVGAQILGVTVGTIPMLIVFAAFSKNLISGLAAAAVKE